MIPIDIQLYIIIPLLIFLSKVADVASGTIRIIFISRGMKLLAPIVGFFEISVWLLAINLVLTNMEHFPAIFAYASGFAIGSYVGILIEEKMAMGISILKVISQYSAEELIEELKERGFRSTIVDAQGQYGPVKIIYIIIKRKHISETLGIVKKFNPNAFYTITDIRSAEGSFFQNKAPKPMRGGGRFSRKSK